MSWAMRSERADLSEFDVRFLIRMIAEVVGLEGSVEAKKRSLLESMIKLVGADVGMWTTSYLCPEKSPVATSVIHNLPAELTGVAAAASQDAVRPEPYWLAMKSFLASRRHFTCTRAELISDEDWSKNPWAQCYSDSLGVEHSVFSVFPVRDDLWSCIGLHRSPGAANFDHRQRLMIHALCAEVPWLHHLSVPERNCSRITRFTPRLRSVLFLLLEGQSEKEIASGLDLSIHTIHQYVKQIYRNLEVSSRGEFHRYFSRGSAAQQLA